MKELLEVIARALVDNPDAIRINEKRNGDTTTLELYVAQEDMGKVIGRQGKIAKSIRAVIKSAAIHKNIRVNVDIVGDERPKQGTVSE